MSPFLQNRNVIPLAAKLPSDKEFIFYRDNRFDWRLKPFIVKGLLVHLAGRCSNFFEGRYRDPNLRYSATTVGQVRLGQIPAVVNLDFRGYFLRNTSNYQALSTQATIPLTLT